jgi:hypothetical protein
MFLLRSKAKKRLNICKEKSSLITCKYYNFCCSGVYDISFITDPNFVSAVRRYLVV